MIVVPGRLELGAAPDPEPAAARRRRRGSAGRSASAAGSPSPLTSGETVRAGDAVEAFATRDRHEPARVPRGLRPARSPAASYLRAARRRHPPPGRGARQRRSPRRCSSDARPARPADHHRRGALPGRSASSRRSAQSLGVDRDNEVHVPVTAAQRLFGDRPGRRARAQGAAHRTPIDAGAPTRRWPCWHDRYPDEEFSAVTQEQILGDRRAASSACSPTVLAAIAGDQPARRRRRRQQHHAGVGARADPRDRPAQGGRRPPARHHACSSCSRRSCSPRIGGVHRHRAGRRRRARAVDARRRSSRPSSPGGRPALAFGVSAAVGIFFGVVPARRAGRLDPVVALRTE